MTASADRIVALVAHARHVPANERRRFADRIRSEPGIGGLLLETCHRAEFYAAITDANAARRIEAALPPGGRPLRGDVAIRHALAVAAGRDSVVIGEDQVLHQLRQALDAARVAGVLDTNLERVFASALRVGRRARSWRQGPPRSLADLAVDLIDRQIGSLSNQDLLIVGAGSIGRLAARAGVKAGARVAVTSRSVDRATEVARASGVRVEAFDPGSRAGSFGGIVVGLAGPWPIGPDTIEVLGRRSTLVVDLSVPPAIPERLRAVLGVRLTTADDFANPDMTLQPIPDRTLARIDALIDRTAAEVLAWLDGHERRAAARALAERADREREAELAELWRRLPDLDPQARETIEGMSRHLADRLLREPLERLGADTDGRHERAIRELWAL